MSAAEPLEGARFPDDFVARPGRHVVGGRRTVQHVRKDAYTRVRVFVDEETGCAFAARARVRPSALGGFESPRRTAVSAHRNLAPGHRQPSPDDDGGRARTRVPPPYLARFPPSSPHPFSPTTVAGVQCR